MPAFAGMTRLTALGILTLLLSSCGNIFANKQVYNNIFVNDIPERSGMVIRNTLLEYFPNRDYENTEYVINVSTSRRDEYYLTGRGGFASRNRISLRVNWSITYRPTNTVLLRMSNTYSESFNIERMGQSNVLNDQLTEEMIARNAARDIALKTFSLMLKIQNNPEILQEGTESAADPQEPIQEIEDTLEKSLNENNY
jgi:hypothetical protein